jgi:hypothetical protein
MTRSGDGAVYRSEEKPCHGTEAASVREVCRALFLKMYLDTCPFSRLSELSGTVLAIPFTWCALLQKDTLNISSSTAFYIGEAFDTILLCICDKYEVHVYEASTRSNEARRNLVFLMLHSRPRKPMAAQTRAEPRSASDRR